MRHPQTTQEFIERAEYLDRSARFSQARRAALAETISDCPVLLTPPPAELPEAPVLDYEAADKLIYGECPECGAPDKRFHRCPAKD